MEVNLRNAKDFRIGVMRAQLNQLVDECLTRKPLVVDDNAVVSEVRHGAATDVTDSLLRTCFIDEDVIYLSHFCNVYRLWVIGY